MKKFAIFCLLLWLVGLVPVAYGHVSVVTAEGPVSASDALQKNTTTNSSSSSSSDAGRLFVTFSGVADDQIVVQVSYLQPGHQQCLVMEQLRNTSSHQGRAVTKPHSRRKSGQQDNRFGLKRLLSHLSSNELHKLRYFIPVNDVTLAGLTPTIKQAIVDCQSSNRSASPTALPRNNETLSRDRREAPAETSSWCDSWGAGQGEEQGEGREAVSCCRLYGTTCAYEVASLSSGYGLFNYRLSTVRHCDCDFRFRTCLRNAGTPAADRLGNVYFNVLGSACFTFKQEKVCAERAWWGRCQRWERQTMASTRPSLSYTPLAP